MTNSTDPDPARTPDLEPGGSVPVGSTPPAAPQTSGLSAPEPATAHGLHLGSKFLLAATILLAAVFLALAIALIVNIV